MKRNPISEAHSARGAAGSGPHKIKKKQQASERKKKHKGQKMADDSEEES